MRVLWMKRPAAWDARGQMNLNDIYKPIQEDLDKVEQSLEDIADVEIPLLSQLLEYALKGGGKRIRPSLTLLCGKFHLYDSTLLVPMATAVEVLHTATLVHDDVVDHSPVRRNKATVSCAWGENRALLLGDYLFAKSGALTASTGNLRVVELFAQTLMTISGGEVRQTSVTFDLKRAREYYYDWIAAKTACLFSMATESGAVLSQSPEDVVEVMKDYGYNFGMAFQVLDDILDFVGEESELGKPVGSDLGEGAFTLPSILFAESHPEDNLLRNIVEKRDAESVALAVEKIRNSPVVDECLAVASDFSSRACQAVERLPDSTIRQALLDLAAYSLQRRK